LDLPYKNKAVDFVGRGSSERKVSEGPAAATRTAFNYAYRGRCKTGTKKSEKNL
jgi:hypothetical protein